MATIVATVCARSPGSSAWAHHQGQQKRQNVRYPAASPKDLKTYSQHARCGHRRLQPSGKPCCRLWCSSHYCWQHCSCSSLKRLSITRQSPRSARPPSSTNSMPNITSLSKTGLAVSSSCRSAPASCRSVSSFSVSEDNPWLCSTCNKPLPPSVLYQRQAPCQQETQSRKARINRVQSDPGVALKHHASSSTPDVIKKFVTRSIRRSKSMCVQKNSRDVEEPTMEVVSRLSKEILRIHLSILVPHTKSPPPKPKAFTVTEV